MYSIYIIVDNEGNPFYVGQTKNLKQSILNHNWFAKYRTKLPVHRKMSKLIREGLSYKFIVIDFADTQDAINELEIKYISLYKEDGIKLKNMAVGGTINPKERAAIKRNKYQMSEQTKKRISEARKGNPLTNNHKKALSKAWEKRKLTPVSQKSKDKISKTSTGTVNIKTYKLLDPDGNIHITTNGLTQFAKKHNLSHANLHKTFTGKRKHHKGWRLIEKC